MSKLWPTLVVLAITACGKENPPRTDVDEIPAREVWICYHPETEHHNRECVEEEYPAGCYVSGDDSKFCWLLSGSECNSEPGPDEYWRELCDDPTVRKSHER